MFNIIPPLLLVLSLAGLIIFLERTNQEEKNAEILISDNFKITQGITNFRNKLINVNHYLVKFLLSFSEKLIIRLRILILRLDRSLFHGLHSLKKHKANSQQEMTQSVYIEIIKDKLEEKTDNIDEMLDNNFKILADINKLEKKLLKNSDDLDLLLNLSRQYLFIDDLSSARYCLIKAFKIDSKNKIVQDLIISIFEKEKNQEVNL